MSNFTLKTSIALLLTPTAVMANTPHVELDPINITVSRSPQLLSKTPARVTVIGAKEIEQNPALNLSDVLQKNASTFNRSQWGGIGQPSSLSLRGTNATHTLVLKDGARLNSQNGLAPLYPAFLDLSDVGQIEIAKGPASVQYGSDAVAGVIQMTTLKPIKNRTFVTGIYGENQTYKAITGADLTDDSGVYAQIRGQRLESNGTRIFNIQDEKTQKAGFEQKGYSAKVGYDKDKINASIAISQNEGVNEYSNTGWQPAPQIDSERQFENRIINTQLSYDINDNLTISARHANIKDTQNVIDPDFKNHYNTKNKETDLNAKWSFSSDQNVLFGATHLDANYDSNQIAQNRQTNKSTGYYAQHQYNGVKFNTQVGVRLEDNDRFGNHTVGQGAVRYHLNPNSSVYANIGTAFRAPTLDEMYSSWYESNPNLKPEESLSYEIGLDHFINQNTKVSLSAYHTEVENLIRTGCVSNCTSPNWWDRKTQYINIDKAEFTGGELGIQWTHNDFFVNANYAHTITKNKSINDANHGKELVYRPKHHANISTGYDNGTYGASISINTHSSSYSNNTNTNKLSGYTTVDLHGFWNIHSNVKLFTNIKNIGDKQYESAYYNMNGTGDTKYINGGREANIGVTLSY